MNPFKNKAVFYILIIIALVISGCQAEIKPPDTEQIKRPDESFLKYGDTNETIIELNKINNSIWVHTSYYEQNGYLTPSNGLLVITEEGLVLIDTPWTEKQMESLDKLIHEAFNGFIKEAVITHAHTDRIGGAPYLKEKKIPITSLEVVALAAEQGGFTVPDQVSEGDLAVLDIDNTEIEIYYPGPGHTMDNTVVWIDKYNLLFGGCVIKEYGASSLGNTSESDMTGWPGSIKAIQERYPDIEIVIPGHGQWGDSGLVDYTLELLKE